MALHLNIVFTRQILYQNFKAIMLLGSAYTQTSFLLQMTQEQKNRIFFKSKTPEEALFSHNQAQLPIMLGPSGVGKQMLERQPDFRRSKILKNTKFKNT